MYLYYGIAFHAMVLEEVPDWMLKELWGGEMRLENSNDQTKWSSALDGCGSLEGHFPSPTLPRYATTDLEFSFQTVVETLSSPSGIGSCELFLVIKGFFHPNTWDGKYSLCIYIQVLRLKRYNLYGHSKFHRTD